MKSNNVKYKIITTIVTIMLVVVVLFFSGCGTSNNDTTVFVTVSSEQNCTVVYDVNTKVMYTKSYYGEFTMLVNANGKPKLYKGE